MIEMKFHCSLCNELAATLQLTPENQLIQSGFMGQITEWIDGASARRIEQPLTQADVVKIYEMDRFWAPFYCPQCNAVYCYNHWQMEVQFDSEFVGWYDCTYGVCPNGHRRLIDD